MISSYDVFDTCLARSVAVPTDLFREMAPVVVREAQATTSTDEFVWARIRGEQLAREVACTEDVTLRDIWIRTSELLGWRYSDAYCELELDAERAVLHPVEEVRHDVGAKRRAGHRIIFVSDTYLPKAFIRDRLGHFDLLRDGDGLYVSSETGTVKWTGNLFGHVLEQEGVRASDIRHAGDNAFSDVQMARKAGLRARLVTATRFTRVEASLAGTETFGTDGPRWAAAMRTSRIGPRPVPAQNGGDPLLSVSQYVAPVLASFVGWVLERARLSGIRRLYFASRDCQIACRLARELSPHFGTPEIRYLLVSRQSLLLPTLSEVSPESIPWMERGYERGTLGSLLAKVELDYHDAEDTWAALAGAEGPGRVIRSPADLERFWDILMSPPMARQVIQTALRRRAAALDYFAAEGLLDDVPSALVDLGWSITSQTALNKLLSHGGRKDPLSGFYLQHTLARPSLAHTGPLEALFAPTPPDRKAHFGALTPHDFASVVEHTLGLADHDSVHHYEQTRGGAVAHHREGPIEFRPGGLQAAVSDGVMAFARAHEDLIVDSAQAEEAAIRHRIQLIMKEVLARPTREMVEEFSDIRCSNDQDHGELKPLARPLTVLEGVADASPIDLPRRPRPPEWQEGSHALTDRLTLAIWGLVDQARRLTPRWIKAALRRSRW